MSTPHPDPDDHEPAPSLLRLWAVNPKPTAQLKDTGKPYTVKAHRVEIAPAGHVVFWRVMEDGREIVVHTRQNSTFLDIDLVE